MARSFEKFYEIKEGRFVFEPTTKARKIGEEILNDLFKIWSPPDHFYHLGKSKGHVEALRVYSKIRLFASIDIENFFGSVTRTKISRSLRAIGFDDKKAFSIAYDSVVDFGGTKTLPYGFIQSVALATLVMECSALGSAIRQAIKSNVMITVYVDDIILSGEHAETLQHHFDEFVRTTNAVKFNISAKKCQNVSDKIEVFNCNLSKSHISTTPKRMAQFKVDYAHASDARRASIEKYITAVNKSQVAELGRLH